MKSDLTQLLKGATLRSQIYKTISGSKFGSIGHLLKNSVKKGVKYVEFTSQGTEAGSDIIKYNLKSNRSIKKLNSSGNQSSLSNKKGSKQVGKDTVSNVQRSVRRLKALSQTQSKQKNKNYMLDNSQKPSKEKKKMSKKHSSNTFTPTHQAQNKNKNYQENHLLSKSKSKLSCKINLESIIEQSSSQEKLITPHQGKQIILANTQSQDKTAKKERKQPISEQNRKKMSKSFTDPQKFIKLIKNEALTISYRILKRKLIEIQIFALRDIQQLSINLQKGNLECQNIQETYTNLSANTLLALFSSVRDINILDPYNYPELFIQFRLQSKDDKFQKYLTLPYIFLNFIDQKEQILSKKSRIKTKLCLENLPINSKKLRILSQIFKSWNKKHSKGQSEFETHFNINGNEFRLKLIEEKDTFTMQLEGRGEEKLTKIIDFLHKLIC